MKMVVRYMLLLWIIQIKLYLIIFEPAFQKLNTKINTSIFLKGKIYWDYEKNQKKNQFKLEIKANLFV